jgi:poly(beta-D-mannuronate) lyase
MNSTLKIAIVAAALTATTAAQARSIDATLPNVATALKKASAGDTIRVAGGTWADIDLRWRAVDGVTVMAETPGAVTVTGQSSLRLSGDGLTISGFKFQKVNLAKGSVIEFRIGHDLANGCRLTDCVVDSCNPERRDIINSYVILFGKHNRVDHCTFTGKMNLGVTLIVNLNDERSIENQHMIDHNYFGPRPVYGSNGAETIRIGTSQQSYMSSQTTVTENMFDRCNGEVEVVSVKSCDNLIKNNRFYECEGLVALRHGLRNRVEDNIFVGNNKHNTGGVRIVDSHHVVTNNTFYNLAGRRFYSALAIMDAVPNSLPNRYVQVEDVTVSSNRFYDCTNIEFGTGRDYERTLAPKDCRFVDNTVVSAGDPYTIIDEDISGITFSGNKELKKAKYTVPTYQSMRQGKGASWFSTGDEADVAWKEITFQPGTTLLKESIVVDCPTRIKCAQRGKKATLIWNSTSAAPFVTIANGGKLEISDIIFDGSLQSGCAVAHAGISTDKSMSMPYGLSVSNCEFINFPESGCCGIRGAKGTFADTITIKNCRFDSLSGNGIDYGAETDDKGRYNADNVIIEGCEFSRLLGLPVNIYRGGSDESTAGPYITVKNSRFDDCCNKERGSVLRLIGPQYLRVENCTFSDSGRGGASIRLDEAIWEDVAIKGCSWSNSGRVISNRNVVID